MTSKGSARKGVIWGFDIAASCESPLPHPILGDGVGNYASCAPKAFQLLEHFYILSIAIQ